MRRSIAVVLSTVTCSLSLTGTAQAAPVLVGSEMINPITAETLGTGRLLFNSRLGEDGAHVTSPISGEIVAWMMVGQGGPFRLRVLEQVGSGTYLATGRSAPETSPYFETVTYPTELPIGAGETIGLEGSNEGDHVGVALGIGASSYGYWSAPPETTATEPDGTTTGEELALSAEVLPPPTVASISSDSGPTAGGTAVVITGTDLSHVKAISFGPTPATLYAVESETRILAISPAVPAAGSVPVTVTTAAGSASADRSFTYVAPIPTSSSTSASAPSAGPPATPHCMVPRLKGTRLAASRRRARAAGCRIGTVTRGRDAARGGKVVGQKPRPGTVTTVGGKIAVRLG
jgi:hypothetical protein